MSLSVLVEAIGRDPEVNRALALSADGGGSVALTSAAGIRPVLLAALTHRPQASAQMQGGPASIQPTTAPTASPPPTTVATATATPTSVVVAVTATTRQAQELAAALRCLVPAHQVAEFPSWETLPHERLSPRQDTVGQRLSVLRRLAHPEPDDQLAGALSIVVAPVRALLQPIVAGIADRAPLRLRPGDEYRLEDVVAELVASGYTRSDLVERRGEFAVRGGLIDVFPPTEEHPLRIEFWGDVVEEVRWFRVGDQRSLEVADQGLWAPACRELLLTDAVRVRAAKLAEQLPGVSDLLHKVAEGIPVEGMESLAPALTDGMRTLLDLLPQHSLVALCDAERVRSRALELLNTSAEFLEASWSNAVAGNVVPIDLRPILGKASYLGLRQMEQLALDAGLGWWTLSTFAADTDADEPGLERLTLNSSDAEPLRGDTDAIVSALRNNHAAGQSVLVVTEGAGVAARVGEVLAEHDLPARTVEKPSDLPADLVTITRATLPRGFLLPGAHLAVYTENDLFGGTTSGTSTKDMRRMPSRRRNLIDPLTLRPGDFVVHEQHGVGRFLEMTQRTVGGATREYLLLEYAPSKRGQPGDRLYVPTDQLDQVTRYVGGESPSVHRLGGSDWAATKSRAKKHVKQIAGELIRLYSARQATKGHAFGPDTPWQRELEDAFAYAETPDQLSSIEEVKADMQREVPMDRLICGDVGYGKTEIAVRAAFKAIQDGKQVAVLCPTTLLVQQHQNTFAERYAQYPVTVASLSRFQSDKEAKRVLEGLADGSIDLVIGTHRLLSPNVRFKDLGLVVIDEEQRFGVEHKEQLKAMRTAVDVLAMSATPIPRTLEMALTGIREMSTLATPPEERHPVLTFVGPYQDKQIGAAIRRELMREGQVFYVHNSVRSIERAAARIRELVPEARVVTAHGQMSEALLEQVVVDFWEKRSDVLVCTTIIETGLDISNANTLIVERADRLGLSQLYQLRGRVGRGRERAYSYFLYPPETPLTETAHDRLATIAANTDLGAGMQVAMKDLEIRGAGNLLGGEQSGHIEGVGFDLYLRLVGEAVAEFRSGGPIDAAPTEVRLELPVDAHLPHGYIPGERLRLEAYRKLSAAADQSELDDIAAELRDRYGALPEPVTNLMAVAQLRILARQAKVEDIVLQGNHVRFAPVELRESQQLRLMRLYPGTLVKPTTRTILVPKPTTARVGGVVLRDTAVLGWAGDLIRAVLLDDIAVAARQGTARRE